MQDLNPQPLVYKLDTLTIKGRGVIFQIFWVASGFFFSYDLS